MFLYLRFDMLEWGGIFRVVLIFLEKKGEWGIWKWGLRIGTIIIRI